MSGYTDGAIENHGIDQATVAFVPKPFTAKDLVDQVHRMLRAR